MFRRKPDIPQEPKIPTPEQIDEDLKKLPDNDSLFNLPNRGLDVAEEAITFEKVRAFVERQEHLKNCLNEMKEKSKSLEISYCELRAVADEIRKQSIEALQ